MYHSVGSDGGSSFVVSYGDGKGGVGPRINQMFSIKYDCWFDGGDFVPSLSRYYPTIIHSNKDRYCDLLYHKREDNFSTAGDGGCGFGRKKTHFYPLRVNLFRNSNDWGLKRKGDICCSPHIF